MFKTVGKQLPKHAAQQPKYQVPQYKNIYGTNNILQHCVVSSETHIIRVWTSCIFCLLFPHLPASYTSNVNIRLITPALYCRIPNTLPYLSFCLYLTDSPSHSHTHTHVRSRKFSTCQPFCHALHTLYITHRNF